MKEHLASLAISVIALLFTLLSFWWMNWRPGKLSVAKPRSFGVWRSRGRELLRIRLPLVLLNSGARPVVVQNLRLLLPELSGKDWPLTFNSTALTLEDNNQKLAIQFPVRSSEAVVTFCDFVRIPGDVSFSARSYAAELQGMIGDSDEWRTLAEFELRISDGTVVAANGEGFIAVDNYTPATGGSIAIPQFPGSV